MTHFKIKKKKIFRFCKGYCLKPLKLNGKCEAQSLKIQAVVKELFRSFTSVRLATLQYKKKNTQ